MPDRHTDIPLDVPGDIQTDVQTYGWMHGHMDTQMCQRTLHMSPQQCKIHAPMSTPNVISYLKLTSYS